MLRLAVANHLKPSHLRRHITPGRRGMGAIDPDKLAAVSDRTTPVVLRMFPELAARRHPPRRPGVATEQRNRRQRNDDAKRQRYAAIRADAAAGMPGRAIERKHNVGHRTIQAALKSPVPPARKEYPTRERARLHGLIPHIDAVLAATPAMPVREIWEHLLNDHHAAVTYESVRGYVASRRGPAPRPPLLVIGHTETPAVTDPTTPRQASSVVSQTSWRQRSLYMDGLAGIGIRSATESDERALAAIDYATWSTQVHPVPLWPLDTLFFNDATSPQNVLLAHEDNHILGYVKLRPSLMPASGGHVQEINGFAVAPHHQGRGIGHLLLDAVHQEAIERRARRITLRVLGTNTRAQALYLAHGYCIEGRLVGQFLLEDRYVDDVLMALETCPTIDETSRRTAVSQD